MTRYTIAQYGQRDWRVMELVNGSLVQRGGICLSRNEARGLLRWFGEQDRICVVQQAEDVLAGRPWRSSCTIRKWHHLQPVDGSLVCSDCGVTP